MNAVPDDEEGLGHFFGCYFNLDWNYWGPDTPSVVAAFGEKDLLIEVEEAARQLYELVEGGLSDADLEKLLDEYYRVRYVYPKGPELRPWLASIADQLHAASRARRASGELPDQD